MQQDCVLDRKIVFDVFIRRNKIEVESGKVTENIEMPISMCD
jgi:hypothetical protein